MFSSVQEGEQAEHGDSALRLELQQLQARRMLRTLAVVQDLADAMLALNDVRGARPETARAAWETAAQAAGWTSLLPTLLHVRADDKGGHSDVTLLCLADMQVKRSAGRPTSYMDLQIE